MHALTADFVFPISSPPIPNGVVVVNENGEIMEVSSPGKSTGGLNPEKYRGILCPGFINAHCHLELSHMKGTVSPGKTLPGFIGEILGKRDAAEELIEKAIEAAEDEMLGNGIVGIGDICNTAHTVKQKKKNRLRYHNFIELFDITPSRSDNEFEKGLSLLDEFRETGGSSSLTPHAPYTVSPQLLKRINEYAYAYDSILSIHNQESESENEMFRSRSGALFQTLSSFGNLYDDWKPTGFNSLASTLVHMPRCNKTLLVHNTYSTPEDVNWAHLYSAVISWCFCPNANLYIENRLPDFQTFTEGSCNIVIGTDSYASNRSLSILDELKTISRHAPQLKLNDLLRWATLNGAEFFGWKKDFGSLEKGKCPGINLLTDINTETLSLTESSTVKNLVPHR